MFLSLLNKTLRGNLKHWTNLKKLGALKRHKRCFHTEELKIEGLPVDKYISKLRSEYETLSSMASASSGSHKRLRQLRPIITVISKRNELLKNVDNLKELLLDSDGDIRKLAEEEKLEFKSELEDINDSLRELLLPAEEEDEFNSISLEVNAGVGGQEAMLFANEILNMYTNFCSFKGWKSELAEYLEAGAGGIRHGSLLINGSGAYKYFRHEAGVHRVQRIPVTEKAGRVHTSTVSVLALPQPDDIQVNIEAKDLKIETKRATGAGGQHVNTTDSAVRVVHLPTGVAVECQTDRSQRKNKEIALLRLRGKLYQMQLDQQNMNMAATKKSQVKSNFRNEKIRTYNFNQDRITDHRLESYNVHNLKGFLTGGEQLENLIGKIDYNRRINMLKQLIEN